MAGLLFSRLVRRKYISADQVTSTKLDRCLSTLDLTALGIGSTLGLGIYVLAGKVAKEQAGPSVSISFLIAAVASVFAGLCYAEFGARVPRAGSAYVYSYVTVGELIAFIIGWNLVMEYVIGTASVAKGYSGYLDFLVDHKINTTMEEIMPIRLAGLADYPDFVAFGITVFLTVVLSIGVKESSKFNNVCTFINLLVVLYVIICGSFKADVHNWELKKEEIPNSKLGDGGFFPYGFAGTLAGAATCFYGFVGFDCIATTGEEAKNPQKAIPVSIVLSLLFIFLAYFGISTILTLMWPYYDQNVDAPLPYVFDKINWPVAKWIVSVGALAGLSTSLLGAMFPLPRILYAMANDGLIFRFLARVHQKTKTPLYATVFGGALSGLMALLFSLDELINMMSIGTLMAYTLVAASVLVLRYKPDGEDSEGDATSLPDLTSSRGQTFLISSTEATASQIIRQCFNIDRCCTPTRLSFAIAKNCISLNGLFCITTSACFTFGVDSLSRGEWWIILLTAVNAVWLLVTYVIVGLQPQSDEVLNFKVPWVPVLPFASILFNVVLMLRLDYKTWIRFAVWIAIGLIIYVFYGIRESSEEYRRKGLPVPIQVDEVSQNEENKETERKSTL